jgi:succinate dehydrogenase flavin-adding protein (antitoxin of CptAB toxin-antitoxin module)
VQSEPASRDHDRLRWHCRRGLLELDILLNRFLDQHLSALSKQDLVELDQLLLLQDNDLLDVVLGRASLQKPALLPILEKIRAS